MRQEGKGRLIGTSRVWSRGMLASLAVLLVAPSCVPGSRSALLKAGVRSGAIRSARFEPGYGCDTLEGDTHSADTHYARHAQCESLTVAPADTDKRSNCDESPSALPSSHSLSGTLADVHSVAANRSEPLISASAAGFRGRAPPVV
jgi:hypothetical protein